MNVPLRDGSVASGGPVPADFGPSAGVSALLDVLPVGVFVLDRDMHVRKMNPAAARLVAWTPDAARGQHCRDVMHCVLCGDECVARRATATGRAHLGGAVTVQARTGTTVPTRIDAVPLEDGLTAIALRREDLSGEEAPPPVACTDQDERIRAALRRTAGHVADAARLLGVHRTTMWRWMAERGLDREDFRPR